VLAFAELRDRLGLDDPRRLIAGGLLLAIGVAIFFAVLNGNPFAVDWHYTYRPAALAMAAGKSPFDEVKLFFTAPWSLIPIIPFALLPEDIGRSLWFVLSLGMFAYIGYRLGGKPVAVLAFLISAPIANCIQTGNIEWLVLLGYVLPPQVGLIFLAMKPQSTFVAILYYVVEAWRKGGFRAALRTVWPVTLIGLLSLLAYGLWPLKAREIFQPAGIFNISIWPQGIPIGLLLAVQSFRSRKREPAMIASPFLSPYTILLSWSGPMAAFVASTIEMVTLSIGSWVFWLIYRSIVG
jgi:hypothetical protein